jgi:glutaredoxin 3
MSIPKILEQYISPGKVFIVSMVICPFCDKAKGLLSDLEVEYDFIQKEDYEETNSELLEAFEKHSGMNTYPKIYIGTKCIGGYSDLNKLFETMKIFKILDDEGIPHAQV